MWPSIYQCLAWADRSVTLRTIGDVARTVHCLDCDRLIEEGPPNPLQDPQPCQNCGSLRRRVAVTATAYIGVASHTQSQGLKITDDVGLSDQAVVKLEPAAIKLEALALRPEPTSTTTIGAATHTCEVRMSPVGDDGELTYAEVVREGKVISAGVGDDAVDALLGVIEYLLPPDHPEYPTEDSPSNT